jgi:hypothetical protein
MKWREVNDMTCVNVPTEPTRRDAPAMKGSEQQHGLMVGRMVMVALRIRLNKDLHWIRYEEKL